MIRSSLTSGLHTVAYKYFFSNKSRGGGRLQSPQSVLDPIIRNVLYSDLNVTPVFEILDHDGPIKQIVIY